MSAIITPEMFTSPPPKVMLEEGEAHLWRVFLEDLPLNLALLSPDEHERADRFKFPPPRERFIKTRSTLRRILASYADQPPENLHFTYGEAGKPMLNPPVVQFNLTHSQNLVLIAVTRDAPAGVDVEYIRELSPVARQEIEQTVFTAQEISEIRKFSAQLQTLSIFRGWTRKEALVKALGEGFRAIRSVSVSLEEIPRVVSPSGYSLYELIPAENAIAAMVLPLYEWRLKAYNFVDP